MDKIVTSEESKKKIGFFTFIAGFVCILFGGLLFSQGELWLAKKIDTAVGRVVGYDVRLSSSRHSGSIYYPVIEFKASNGKLYKISSFSGGIFSPSVHSEQKVIYDQANPNRAVVGGFWSVFVFPGCLIAFGLFLIIFGRYFSFRRSQVEAVLPIQEKSSWESHLSRLRMLNARSRKNYLWQWNIGRKLFWTVDDSIELQASEQILFPLTTCICLSRSPGKSIEGAVDVIVTNQRICLPLTSSIMTFVKESFGRNNLWFGFDVIHGSVINRDSGFFSNVSKIMKGANLIDSNIQFFQYVEDSGISEDGAIQVGYLLGDSSCVCKIYHPDAKKIYQTITSLYPVYASKSIKS